MSPIPTIDQALLIAAVVVVIVAALAEWGKRRR